MDKSTGCASGSTLTTARPGLPPSRYFRPLMIRDFEGLDVDRAIRAAGGRFLCPARVLGLVLPEAPPDADTPKGNLDLTALKQDDDDHGGGHADVDDQQHVPPIVEKCSNAVHFQPGPRSAPVALSWETTADFARERDPAQLWARVRSPLRSHQSQQQSQEMHLEFHRSKQRFISPVRTVQCA